MLRAVADLDPHHGKVFLDDVECNDISPGQWRCMIGLLPAESQWWYETVGEHFGNSDMTLLSDLGFGKDILDHQVIHLSSGERQRLGLIRLLCNQPHALLLDEPTASLDSENTRRVERLIHEFRMQHQAPVIWVSHDSRQIERISDRHFQLIDGNLIS